MTTTNIVIVMSPAGRRDRSAGARDRDYHDVFSVSIVGRVGSGLWTRSPAFPCYGNLSRRLVNVEGCKHRPRLRSGSGAVTAGRRITSVLANESAQSVGQCIRRGWGQLAPWPQPRVGDVIDPTSADSSRTSLKLIFRQSQGDPFALPPRPSRLHRHRPTSACTVLVFFASFAVLSV